MSFNHKHTPLLSACCPCRDKKQAGSAFCCPAADISIQLYLSCCRFKATVIHAFGYFLFTFLALACYFVWATLAFIIFNVFCSSSLEIFLMQYTHDDLSFVEPFTAWCWVSCYLQIREEMYLWYGAVVDLSVPCSCGVQFANWKIMRVIMANHSLKFIC